MSTKIRHEEYAAIGDFIKTSFVRDQSVIMKRYPKLNDKFLATYNEKLEAIKTLESREVLTHEQKNTTVDLYTEAATLNKELSFINSYITSAQLNTDLVSDLKNELSKNNIEGAIAKIPGVKQFLMTNASVLEAEGMDHTFPETLDRHKTTLAKKNALQNEIMNNGKKLVNNNSAMYEEFYEMITTITNAGKLVFDNTVTEDEYVIKKIIARMRAPKHTSEKTANN